jgi:hypothetical protein
MSRRMIPRALTLMPGVVASMAKARMAERLRHLRVIHTTTTGGGPDAVLAPPTAR